MGVRHIPADPSSDTFAYPAACTRTHANICTGMHGHTRMRGYGCAGGMHACSVTRVRRRVPHCDKHNTPRHGMPRVRTRFSPYTRSARTCRSPLMDENAYSEPHTIMNTAPAQ